MEVLPVNAKSRPIHLNLFKMTFPPMAIVSILHRLSGVLLFLFLPFALYTLSQSLGSHSDFSALKQLLDTIPMKLLMWIFLSAVAFHVMAGLRHMLMDCGLAESVQSGRRSAYFIIFFEVVAVILIGVGLW